MSHTVLGRLTFSSAFRDRPFILVPMQLAFDVRSPNEPEHITALESNRRHGWVRASCSCSWHGPWRSGRLAEDQAWGDAEAHERPAA